MSSQNETKAKGLGANNFHNVKSVSKERPWLLPSVSLPTGYSILRTLAHGFAIYQNRKLRHLQGVSLRNLALSSSHTKARGKTTDDESLPHALKTPAKLLSQRENKLEHSRSSNDLRSTPESDGVVEDNDSRNGGAVRPQPPIKPRRRSTLNWTNAPPRVRQMKLEDTARERMADTWFSLHCSSIDDPIYVSEIVEKAMNASFRFFDLNVYGPAVTRLDELTIKYWAKTEDMDQYMLLIEVQLCLRSLQFIGKTVRLSHSVIFSRF